MTITITPKNLHKGDRIENWGIAARDLRVETVHEMVDEDGIYPVVEMSDGSEWELTGYAAKLTVTR